MSEPALRYGIPDVRLSRAGGGEIDPADFAGHKLVVFFCPAEVAAAAQEVYSYRVRADAFASAGAWLIGILRQYSAEQDASPPGTHITLAHDPEGTAWLAFEGLLEAGQQTEAANGGTFLFERGGCLAGAWAGSGHAEDALQELHRRA